MLYMVGGHPSAGMCRQIGFPLAQEAMQAGGFLEALNKGVNRAMTGLPGPSDLYLPLYLAKGKAEHDTWMGSQYWRQRAYGSLDDLIDGFVETATVTCSAPRPC